MTVQRIETRSRDATTIKTARFQAGLRLGLVHFGDPIVLAAITVSPNIFSLPFFPLRWSIAKDLRRGKIPGGFLKREGRPSDREILPAG